MNYYLNKESVFVTASRSYILTLCVTVLHTWVRTLRCSRCCLCLESRRPSWFPRVSLRTGRTTGRTSCSRMTPELETQTRRRRTITSEQQRAQTAAESRPGLGMSWGVHPFWKIKITMWLLSRLVDSPALFSVFNLFKSADTGLHLHWHDEWNPRKSQISSPFGWIYIYIYSPDEDDIEGVCVQERFMSTNLDSLWWHFQWLRLREWSWVTFWSFSIY